MYNGSKVYKWLKMGGFPYNIDFLKSPMTCQLETKSLVRNEKFLTLGRSYLENEGFVL